MGEIKLGGKKLVRVGTCEGRMSCLDHVLQSFQKVFTVGNSVWGWVSGDF